MRKVWVRCGIGLGGVMVALCGFGGWWLYSAAPPSFEASSPDKSSPGDVVSSKIPDLKPAAADDGSEIRVSVGGQIRDGFPETLKIQADGRSFDLQCTGLYIRSRMLLVLPFDLYAIANFTESPSPGDAPALLDNLLVDGKPKVYLLRFLKKLSGSQIHKAIQDEIDSTFKDVDMVKHGGEIQRFVQKFDKGSNKGEVVYMCWLPGNRIYCGFNDPKRLELISSDASLTRAIWRIWCGENAGPERVGLVSRLVSNPSQR